jgi:DNA-binding NarL/FixJ family response regulator
LISVVLADAGYEVIGPAATAAEAADLISSAGLDAALLNVTLRFETSFPVAEILASRSIPFAFITGHEPDELPPHLQHHPMLRKPIGTDGILAMVKSLL